MSFTTESTIQELGDKLLEVRTAFFNASPLVRGAIAPAVSPLLELVGGVLVKLQDQERRQDELDAAIVQLEESFAHRGDEAFARLEGQA